MIREWADRNLDLLILVFLCAVIAFIITSVVRNHQTDVVQPGRTDFAQFQDTVIPHYQALPFYQKEVVGCDSQSMGLLFSCNDILLLERPKIPYHTGDVFVFVGVGNETGRIVHRYIGCANEACTFLIFKGDANTYPEIVPRENVLYRVAGVMYHEYS